MADAPIRLAAARLSLAPCLALAACLALTAAPLRAGDAACAPAAPVGPCLEAAAAAEAPETALALLDRALEGRRAGRAPLLIQRGTLRALAAPADRTAQDAAMADLDDALALIGAPADMAARRMRTDALAARAAVWFHRAEGAPTPDAALFDAGAAAWGEAIAAAEGPGFALARGWALKNRASLRLMQAQRLGGSAALTALIRADAWAAVEIAEFVGDRDLLRAAMPMALGAR